MKGDIIVRIDLKEDAMGKSQGKRSLCILTDDFISGGTENVIIDTLQVLSETFDVTLFVATGNISETLRKKIPPTTNIECGSFRWTFINELRIHFPAFWKSFLRKTVNKKYDILIVTKTTCRAAGLSRFAKHNIYWNHNTHDVMYAHPERLDLAHKLYRIRLGSIYRRFDEVWQANPQLVNEYKTAFKIENCHSIANPINVRRILELSEKQLSDCSFSDDVFTIVIVGRLSKEKGYDRVIRAAGRINVRSSFEIVIIGDGPEKKKLKEISESCGIEKHVRFLGEKGNPYPYMKAADVLICPSHRESFGLVLMEAMVLQTPVIATRTIGSEYVTQNGKYGMIIDNTDDSITEALEKMLHGSFTPGYSLKDAFDWASSFDLAAFRKRILSRLNNVE